MLALTPLAIAFTLPSFTPTTSHTAAVSRVEIDIGNEQRKEAAKVAMPVTEADIMRHAIQVGHHQTEVTLEALTAATDHVYSVFFSVGAYAPSDGNYIDPSVFSGLTPVGGRGD